MTIRAENCKKRLQPTVERRILTILTVCRSLLIATDGAVIFLTHGIWENAPIWPDGILPVIRVSVLLRKCGKLISLRRRIFRRQRLISAVAGICASCRGADARRTDKVKLPEGLEELDLCRNMRLAGDLNGQKKLKKLVLEGENLIENKLRLPESLEELHCSETKGILAITGNLADCTKLKKLSLIGCDLRGCGLARLSESVEELDLSFSYNMSRFMTDLSAYKNLKKVTFNGTDFAVGDLKLPEGCAAVINGRAAVGAMSGIETAEAVRTDKVVKAGRSEKAAPERSKVLRGMIAGKRAMMSRNRA